MEQILSPLSASFGGELRIHASKSHSQRLLAAALLCPGLSLLEGVGDSDDEKAALSIIRQAGASVVAEGSLLRITSQGLRSENFSIDCGESGLAARLFAPILATGKARVRIEGRGTLLERPMQPLLSVLERLGLAPLSNQGKLPLEVQGPLQPRSVRIDGSLSSQFVTGLLFALSKALSQLPENAFEPIVLEVERPSSIPYIELSLQVLSLFGINLRVQPDRLLYRIVWEERPVWRPPAASVTVEGDWSGAAFLLVAGALAGEVRVQGLNPLSLQADRRMVEALEAFGAEVRLEDDGALCVAPGEERAFEFDALHCPDLFPPLAVLAGFARGRSRLSGVHRLFAKESNRAQALCQELGKMGLNISVQNDDMLIDGVAQSRPARVHSRGDHRIAMAAAVAALRLQGGNLHIEQAQSVSKSYPSFWEHWRHLGAMGF